MRAGPAILVTRVQWRSRQVLGALAPRYASADPVGFYQVIAGVLVAFVATLPDGVSVPF